MAVSYFYIIFMKSTLYSYFILTYPASDFLKLDHILFLQLLYLFEKSIIFLEKYTKTETTFKICHSKYSMINFLKFIQPLKTLKSYNTINLL